MTGWVTHRILAHTASSEKQDGGTKTARALQNRKKGKIRFNYKKVEYTGKNTKNVFDRLTKTFIIYRNGFIYTSLLNELITIKISEKTMFTKNINFSKNK